MKNSVKKYGKTALVTGGSRGIGFAVAKQLAKAGHNLILAARNETQLEKAAQQLRTSHKVNVETVSVDLTKHEDIERLAIAAIENKVGIAVLSAGMESTGNVVATPIAELDALIALNVSAPLKLARLLGADMASRKQGAIMFFSSLFGYQGVPLVANYSASKAFILSLGEAMSLEMRPFGVDVLVVSPGLTDTNMPAQMPINFKKLPITNHKPDKVARVAMRSLGRKASVVPGLLNKIFAFENRFIPRLWPTRLFGFLIRRALNKDLKGKLTGYAPADLEI